MSCFIKILKEELMKQKYIIESDQHPIYKLENFQTEKCYSFWKNQFLANLNKLIENLSHIQIDETNFYTKESIQKYSDKLNSFPNYYDQLVDYIFK